MKRYTLSRCALNLTLLMGLLFFNSAISAQTILVLGDSLSSAYGIEPKQGWVHLLERRLEQQPFKYKVVNAAVAGDTTSKALKRLPRLLKQHKPNTVIIELGGNDGLRGYPAHKLQKNLHRIISLSQRQGADVLLLGIRIPPRYDRRYKGGFLASYNRVANEASIDLMPLFMANIDDSHNTMQADGIHPNAFAQTLLLNNVWPYLQPLLTRAQPSSSYAVATD